MLPNYYDHVLTYVNTLLNKFYGIHEVRPAGGYKVEIFCGFWLLLLDFLYIEKWNVSVIVVSDDNWHLLSPSLLILRVRLLILPSCSHEQVPFVVVGNILQSDLYIHRRFDLKGSSQGRSLSRVLADEGAVFKDLDLELYFLLNPLTRHRILT